MILLTILIFILILGLLIFVHELGHFIMARRAGMKVEEFGFGFPPRLVGIKKGGTLYSVNLIPLGGFVKILGEHGESTTPDSFAAKSVLRRFSVLVAGVTMNAVLAWILLSIALIIGLPTALGEGETLPSSAKSTKESVSIIFVEPDSPAERAGVRAGDAIIAIDGNAISAIQQLQDYTSLNAGRLVRYQIVRGREDFYLDIIPRVSPPAGQGPLGIQPALVAKVSYPWYEAVWRGFSLTFSLSLHIIMAFGRLIGSLFTDRSLVASLTGPVGIAVLTRDAAQLGLSNLIYFTSILSINLAIINALPFPALDGGRMLFLLIEKLWRKKLNIAFEHYANTIGFFLLISLMIWITIRDVGRFSEQINGVWKRIVGYFL